MNRQSSAPRKPLPAREKEICARIKQARLLTGLSQQAAADQLGITRERLASYEDARVAIRFDMALKFCRQFIISEEWLALGEDEIISRIAKASSKGGLDHKWQPMNIRLCMSLATEPAFHQIKTGTLFSQAYDERLSHEYLTLRLSGSLPRLRILSGDSPQIAKNFIMVMVDLMIYGFDPLQKVRFFKSVIHDSDDAAKAIKEGRLTNSEEKQLIAIAKRAGKLSARTIKEMSAAKAFVKAETQSFLEQYYKQPE